MPLIASGGAGTARHFIDVFDAADVDGALAATVFHNASLPIPQLKAELRRRSGTSRYDHAECGTS